MVKVDVASYISRKLRNKKQPYTCIVHTVDSTGNEFGRFEAATPEIKDSLLYSMYEVDSADILSEYYQVLKSNVNPDYKWLIFWYKRENSSKMKVFKEHREWQLNQLHIFVVDSSRNNLNMPHGIKSNQIIGIEKVNRFDRRWLWIPVGGPIFLIVLLWIYALWRMSKSSWLF